MAAVISVFVVLLVWRFLIVFGEAAFESGGLPPGPARFEARSALAGAGYTTAQSEFIVRNPATQRVASMLIICGYFGPPVILALLGASFVVPDNVDLATRTLTLALLVVAFLVLDRTGVLRFLSARPARVLAQRVIERKAVDTWIAVHGHVVAAASIPVDPSAAVPLLAALAGQEVTILAVEPAEPGPARIPTAAQPAEPQPGERVVVFGPERALAALQTG